MVSGQRLLGRGPGRGAGAYHKQYGTPYLFAEPRQFLHTHFPALAKWQLLDRPLSAEQFAALPLLQGRFFESGLRLATPLQRLQSVGESVQFSIAAPEDVLLLAGLVEPGKTGRERLEGRTLLRRGRKEINVLVTFPSAGHWGVELYTKSREEQGLYWQAATLEFEASAGTAWTLAETYSSDEGIDSFLEGPVYVPLTAGKEQDFKIRVRNAENVQLRLGPKKWIPMQPAADDPELYQVTATVPADSLVRIVGLPTRPAAPIARSPTSRPIGSKTTGVAASHRDWFSRGATRSIPHGSLPIYRYNVCDYWRGLPAICFAPPSGSSPNPWTLIRPFFSGIPGS